jgi:hypothetical protein
MVSSGRAVSGSGCMVNRPALEVAMLASWHAAIWHRVVRGVPCRDGEAVICSLVRRVWRRGNEHARDDGDGSTRGVSPSAGRVLARY